MLTVSNLRVKRGARVTLHDISLSLPAGKTLAVVGESGAGKSTLIAAILGLLKPSGGQIAWNGAPTRMVRPALVMQEPRAAFNPVLSLRQSIMEPVVAQNIKLTQERLQRLCAGLELPLDILDRRPGQVSIGQAQRVGILRALIASPPLILFDEPLSALDAVAQKHTARLISDLQGEEGFAALIVTHDLGYAVAHADQIAVLKAGRIEEIADSETFALNPRSEYCRTLRDAAIALGALEAVA
ncbi:peptide/nickel transport system ATP-binding protein [Ruegeria intermedia]|uniref:Peptide/nickel transport system ATP-binding protein n=1 Tax=Ruegeria intermedia TaxID=996115 RepID=A0A1M5BMG5_9RHOB|nr:dipeptide/oligopeptide/nickel ABC transporter ATP-binding protein [Ruegeria intermedia]SHF43595.1 peptide/nickel transport system ATP-binding protein [Ruegeria intermedia]